MAKKASPAAIVANRIETVAVDGRGHPAIHIKGDAPKSGDVLTFTGPNGVVYSGKVSAATADEDTVKIEFADGLTPA